MHKTIKNILSIPETRGWPEFSSILGKNIPHAGRGWFVLSVEDSHGNVGNPGFIRLLFISLALSGFLIASPSQASPAYGVTNGFVSVYSSGIVGDNRTFTPQQSNTSHSDELAMEGFSGSFANARYFADLSTGQFENYASAINGYREDLFQGWTLSQATAETTMVDTLYFQVPSGTYPNGVDVALNGYVILDFLNSGLSVSGGSVVVDFGRFQGFGFPSPAQNHNVLSQEGFHLSASLLPKNSVLVTAATIGVPMSIGGEILISTGNAGAGGGYARIEAIITGIDTPQNVSWTSASGVFLSQPVPIPAAIWLFVSGINAIIGFSLSRQCSKREKMRKPWHRCAER